MEKLALGSDHAGFKLKERIKNFLKEKGFKVEDYGTNSEERADYPDYAHKVASAIESGESKRGIVICGSGNGINIAANRHKAVRSALCWKAELAELARAHNDANVLALPARFIGEDEALKCIEAFLKTEFEGGRHSDRINKINL